MFKQTKPQVTMLGAEGLSCYLETQLVTADWPQQPPGTQLKLVITGS